MNEDKVQQSRREQEELATRERAAIIGFPYLDLRTSTQTLSLVQDVMNVDDMYKNKMLPLEAGDSGSKVWQFAVTSTTPQSSIQGISKYYKDSGRTTQFYLISASSYKELMQRYDPPKVVRYDDITIAQAGDSQTLQQVSETLRSVNADQVFVYLVDQADKLGASDIHIENQRNNIRIRMRVDGALHPVAELDQDRYRIIMGVLASRANISTAAKEAQSGHMQQEIDRDGSIFILNIRVETVPTMFGQDAVLRLFNFNEEMLNLDRLGIGAEERREIDEIISHPRGMVLMVGPTGSGKSTTLYSMINALNTTDRKIITLEDPVEYSISGISQIPVDTTGGQSFSDDLRALLRLDPDVVMIGEIRDSDTAKTAIQASITGHLVLSSFHANSSAAAFSRMIDLIGVNPIFSTAIRLIIAQRLVRKLDDSTKQSYIPDDATKSWLHSVLDDLPEHVAKPDIDNCVLYQPVPSQSSPFGYAGRIVVMEQMVVGDEIQTFIRGDIKDVNTNVIEASAKKSGMVTLLQRGVLMALEGQTTLEEINRVI